MKLYIDYECVFITDMRINVEGLGDDTRLKILKLT